MAKFEDLINNKIAQNILVWGSILFLLLVVMRDSQDGGDIAEAFIYLGMIAIAVYVSNLLISPLFKTRKFIFFFLFFLNIAFCSFLTMFLIIDEPSISKGFNFFGNFLLGVTFGSSLKLVRDSFIIKQQEKEAELKLLKAQLNPHFLFNTLNNLYGLSVIKSEKLPGLMLQLSDLLRYSLYETKEVFVPLEKEIKYLENYIALEKIRLESETEINFSFQGDVIGKQIAPMLLIVFVENTFKHLGKANQEKSRVEVSISVVDDQLNFSCINTFDSSKEKEQNLEKGKSGIGLVNAKKRLQLIYPDSHKLEIQKEKETFKVQLGLTI